ncbi:MAG: TonB-dependent receptor [Bacteroidaceae bacterium]|nr:TonB-dependent receptor [Bacteroidaceae bacterium]
MKIKNLLSAIALCCCLPNYLLAQQEIQKDSIPSTREAKNRNVMLNASSDVQPRHISIGLPAKFASDIFEDGLPVSFCYWPVLPYTTWHNGVSQSSTSLMSLSESALQYGILDYIVSTTSRHAGNHFQGLANYTLNHHGKQQFDVNLSGPIAKGWGYTLGVYQNFDPGSNKLDVSRIQDRMEIYKIGLNKRWAEGRGEVSLLYQYATYTSIADARGPFYFNGADGSVDKFEDFDLGHDQYLPNYNPVHYLDIETNKEADKNIVDANRDHAHQLIFNLNYTWQNGTKFTFGSKLKDGEQLSAGYTPAGIFKVTASNGYTYENGQAYEGYVQNRHFMMPRGIERSWLTTATLSGKAGNRKQHAWRIGLNEWFNYQRMSYNTGIFPHEVKEDPKKLLLNGKIGTNYNAGADYYHGHENRLGMFISDDWTVNNRLWLSVGFRIEWQNTHGKGAFAYTADGKLFEPANIRKAGFNIVTGKPNRFTGDWINPSFTFNGRFTITRGFGLLGEYVYVRQRPNMQDYAGCYMPVESPININMLRGGIYYNADWIQLTSQVFHISQTNYKSRSQFTNPADQSETVTLPIVNDVATFGWTTDAMLTPFKGFSFHGLLTLQNPQYKNFKFQPIFKDGPGQLYDFNNKNTTAMSKMIIELDPSYQTGKWRFWLSFRYQSKQYINKTNTLYFKGRWETFGGIDYTLNEHVSFALNVVNILNQKGASGNIPAADLATDVSAYQHHYLMAGNYIRPFTMELKAAVKF